MINLPDFEHKLDRYTSYYIRLNSARWLLVYTSIVILLYVYLPKLSISYALHKPTTNNKDQQIKKRKIISVNNVCLIVAILMGFCYNSFLSYISSLDLVLITKRLGRNCMSLYVPLLFLTMRPSPLPNILYLNLIPIHKWLGRLLVLQALLHTILYTCFYYKLGVLWKLKKLANVYGILSMIGFILIVVLSLSKIRRKDYRVFYISHYIITWMTVIMLQYHARPRATYYTVANISILMFQIAYRLYLTRVIEFDDVEEISQSFKRVKFSKKLLAKEAISPGCHLRINNKHDNIFKDIFFNLLVPLQHPFTIESLPSDDYCALIIKNGRFPVVKGKKYYVSGAFEPRLPFFNNSIFAKRSCFSGSTLGMNNFGLAHNSLKSLFGNKDKKVLIVTAGSAVSFGLPILQILNSENYKCKMYWITRDLSDLKLIKKNYQNLEIYVTKATSEEESLIIDSNSFNSSIDLEENYNSQEDSILTMHEDSRLINSSAPLTLTKSPGLVDKKNNIKSAEPANSLPIFYGNYGDENNLDEMDFTQATSEVLQTKKSQFLRTGKHFREPAVLYDLGENVIESTTNNNKLSSVVESTGYGSIANNQKITIPKGLKVRIGRPTLGFKELLWIFDYGNEQTSECNGNDLSDGACLENIYLQTLGVGNAKNDSSSENEVLVIAAGPLGLVENTRNWAVLHNFQFYEEAFLL